MRAAGARGLSQIGSYETREPFLARLAQEQDYGVAVTIITALEQRCPRVPEVEKAIQAFWDAYRARYSLRP